MIGGDLFMDSFKKSIAASIAKAIQVKLAENEIMQAIERPPKPELGDYAFPSFRLAKMLKKNPNEIAAEIAAKIKLPKEVSEIKTAGPYVNFFLSKSVLTEQTISSILKQKEKYGSSLTKKAEKIMVEYSSPNTNKPLHIGHLRNDSIGMSIVKVLEVSGAKVIKANLFSDRGIHICQSMLAYKKWGNEEKPGKLKPDHLVGKYYVLFNQKLKEEPSLKEELSGMLRKWETNDKTTKKLWNKMNGWAMKGFKETYKNFGSEFDAVFFESDFYHKAKPLVELGLKKRVFFRDESGAVIASLKERGLENKTILRADGTSIYITNDLPLTKHKFEHFKLDKALWVVASEQDNYFRQLFLVLKLLGFKWAENCHHLSYGLVKLEGGTLKSREGKVVDADELIESVTELALKELGKRYPELSAKERNERAKKICLAAIKFYMLKNDLNKEIMFEMNRAVSFEGDSGPYVQYTYARAKSILRKLKRKGKIDFSALQEKEEIELLNILRDFPAVVETTAASLSPHSICQYLLSLGAAFNTFYHQHQVIKADSKTSNARLALVEATSIVLKNGLRLLNIDALERM